MTRDALQQQFQFIDTEGLGHIVVSSVFHGLDGGLHRPITGHHDDDGFGSSLLDATQRVQPTRPGQAQVEQGYIHILSFEQPVGMLRRISNDGTESKRLRNLAAGFANLSFVIHDQEIEKIRWLQLWRGKHGSHGGRRHGVLFLFGSGSAPSFISGGTSLTGWDFEKSSGTSGRSTLTHEPQAGVLATWIKPPLLVTIS